MPSIKRIEPLSGLINPIGIERYTLLLKTHHNPLKNATAI